MRVLTAISFLLAVAASIAWLIVPAYTGHRSYVTESRYEGRQVLLAERGGDGGGSALAKKRVIRGFVFLPGMVRSGA
jgi:hypothetical protein